jgi:hypothetical protein
MAAIKAGAEQRASVRYDIRIGLSTFQLWGTDARPTAGGPARPPAGRCCPSWKAAASSASRATATATVAPWRCAVPTAATSAHPWSGPVWPWHSCATAATTCGRRRRLRPSSLACMPMTASRHWIGGPSAARSRDSQVYCRAPYGTRIVRKSPQILGFFRTSGIVMQLCSSKRSLSAHTLRHQQKRPKPGPLTLACRPLTAPETAEPWKPSWPRSLPIAALERRKMIQEADLMHRSARVGIANFRRFRSNLFGPGKPKIRGLLVGHRPSNATKPPRFPTCVSFGAAGGAQLVPQPRAACAPRAACR